MATHYIDPKRGPKRRAKVAPEPTATSRVAKTEMRCVRCRRVIQPGQDIYLLGHVPGALPPDTKVACSRQCRERWQALHPEITATPRRKPKNVRVARIESQCVRCHRVIQPGRDIYLLAHVPGALPPDTPIACSRQCRERWRKLHPEATRTALKRLQPAPEKPEKRRPAVTETRTELRDGVKYIVTIHKEKKKPGSAVRRSL